MLRLIADMYSKVPKQFWVQAEIEQLLKAFCSQSSMCAGLCYTQNTRLSFDNKPPTLIAESKEEK